MKNEFIKFLEAQIGDKSLGQIEIITGVSKSYLSKVLRGERSTPKPQTLEKLSKALPCSYEELLSKALSNSFNENIKNINTETNITPANLGVSHIRIPVYGTIPAGIPIDMIEDTFIEDYEDIDASWLKGGNTYFALKVNGTSMTPKFEDGDVLILKKQDNCENGDFCAISINHTECTFKKVLKKENGITLMPLNPEFEPMFFTNKEIEELPITILGIVKEVRRSL